jgi:prophage maintenance system killer protein
MKIIYNNIRSYTKFCEKGSVSMEEKKNEIILFENQGVKLEVNLKDETVWLNLEQMSKLFERDKSVISRHIKNALSEELENEQVVAKFATTTKHGAIDGKVQTHMVDYYNLDMIVSIGYRVKSQNGILFRKWATQILKDYMLKGYAVNQRRLEYLEKTIKLIDIANRMDERLEGNDAKEILKVIGEYSKALDLLDDYDHKTLKKIDGSVDERKIEYKNCIEIINKLRFNEKSTLFAVERDRGLESIIGNIYQSFAGKEIYKSVEEKGANFLYLIVKNHVFADGNKRIAATLFIYFLNFYGILYKNGEQTIDNNTLAALTLLIAESNPKEKDVIIDLVMNFLNN